MADGHHWFDDDDNDDYDDDPYERCYACGRFIEHCTCYCPKCGGYTSDPLYGYGPYCHCRDVPERLRLPSGV